MMLRKGGVITRERLHEQPQVHGELREDGEEDVEELDLKGGSIQNRRKSCRANFE